MAKKKIRKLCMILPEGLHYRIRVNAAKRDITMTDLIVECIEKAFGIWKPKEEEIQDVNETE